MSVLLGYSRGARVGLPVGGPAARVLSEIYLRSSDLILRAKGIDFCRYADDYLIFAKNEREATRSLSELALVLAEEGLSLQKLKTRVMRKNEYLRSYTHEPEGDLDRESLSFLHLPLRYNPYSPTAAEDYAALQASLGGYNVLGMLAQEMKKSRVHQQLTKKLLYAARYIDDVDVDSAVLTVSENLMSILTVLPSVAAMLFSLLPRAGREASNYLGRRIVDLLEGEESPSLLDMHRMFFVRLLAAIPDEPAVLGTIWRQYEEAEVPLVRKECVWALSRRGGVAHIASLTKRFERSSQWERRALLAASYVMGREGAVFRKAAEPRQTPYEKFVVEWCESKEGHVFDRESRQ